MRSSTVDALGPSFRLLLAELERRGHEISHSALRPAGWTVTVNPRPLCVFRVRLEGASGQLTVCRRRPFFYRELLRRTVDAASMDDTMRDVVEKMGPGRSTPSRGARQTVPPEPAADTWPLLKRLDELTPADFNRHPVWVNCHVEDYDRPWHEQTDEETFRPWTGALPVSPSQGMFLVRARSRSHDGSTYLGFLTPAVEPDVATLQPHVFIGDAAWGFWGGQPGVTVGWRQQFYEAIRKEPDEVFPLATDAEAGLANGVTRCTVEGFCWYQGSSVAVER